MDIATDLPSMLSALGLPVGALALGYGLVRGAEAIEKDAKEDRLKDIANLLKERSFTGLGKLGTAVVPLTFTKTFGSDPLSLRFVSRSILASLIFWIILLAIKHVDLLDILSDVLERFFYFGKEFSTLLLCMFLIDWLSLAKANVILRIMSKHIAVGWLVSFVIIDIIMTMLLLVVILSAYYTVLVRFHFYDTGFSLIGTVGKPIQYVPHAWNFYYLVKFIALSIPDMLYGYVYDPLRDITAVAVPSTMLTSVWVIVFLTSTILTKIVVRLEYLRRFTVWWFDIDAHPLKAIATVAATLIVLGAFVLKALRWGSMMV